MYIGIDVRIIYKPPFYKPYEGMLDHFLDKERPFNFILFGRKGYEKFLFRSQLGEPIWCGNLFDWAEALEKVKVLYTKDSWLLKNLRYKTKHWSGWSDLYEACLV